MIKEQEVLNDYKKYDYLNKDKEKPLIKILVSYIKPSFLFKSDILTPIHLGRAIESESSKDGLICDDDLKWLHENCIGDNDFDGNISSVNRRVGFLTGTYWAWKNYEKLGNPEYFASFGYRNFLDCDFLQDLSKYDLIVPKMDNASPTIKKQLIAFHGNRTFIAMEKAIKDLYPDEWKDVVQYFNMPKGYFHELYVMKKSLFFNYCEWIIPIMNYLLNFSFETYEENENIHKVSREYFNKVGDKRDVAFIIERITGYYLYKLTKSTIKYRDVTFYKMLTGTEKQKISSVMLNLMRKNVKTSIMEKF